MQGKLLPGIEKGNTSFGIIGKSFGESVTVLGKFTLVKPREN